MPVRRGHAGTCARGNAWPAPPAKGGADRPRIHPSASLRFGTTHHLPCGSSARGRQAADRSWRPRRMQGVQVVTGGNAAAIHLGVADRREHHFARRCARTLLQEKPDPAVPTATLLSSFRQVSWRRDEPAPRVSTRRSHMPAKTTWTKENKAKRKKDGCPRRRSGTPHRYQCHEQLWGE